MALLTDKKTANKLRERLEEFSNFGMILHYLLEEKRVSKKELDDIFFCEDDEKSRTIYKRLLKVIKANDIDKAFDRYKLEVFNSDELNIDNYKNRLNLIYISKLLDKLNCEEMYIDKTVINTYNYLLEEVTQES